jgi:hypothetical protein
MPPRNHDWGDLGFTPEEIRAMEAPPTTPPIAVRPPASVAQPHRGRSLWPFALLGGLILIIAFGIYLGSIHQKQPTPTSASSVPTTNNADCIAVARAQSTISNTRHNIRLRREPALTGDEITLLSPGTSVVVTGYTSRGWVRVETTAGAGFIFGAYVPCPALPFKTDRDQSGAVVVLPDGGRLRP